MAASLNDLHKPFRLDADPSSPNGAKQFKHWLRVFTGFLERCEAAAAAQEALATLSRFFKPKTNLINLLQMHCN